MNTHDWRGLIFLLATSACSAKNMYFFSISRVRALVGYQLREVALWPRYLIKMEASKYGDLYYIENESEDDSRTQFGGQDR